MISLLPAKRDNPYWQEARHYLGDWQLTLLHRARLCQQYAWAIPAPETLDFVARWLGPKAVEMGAGKGYWAAQLAALGVQIDAYDLEPPEQTYYPVKRGWPGDLVSYPDCSLFLCWPPERDRMAFDCLALYPGRRLVYIGEGKGGRTASDAFFEALEGRWQKIAEHPSVHWPGVHDAVAVYGR